MKKIIFLFIIGILICKNNEMSNLSKHLKAFEPYIGKTYQGEFAESTPENPVFDIQHWERILNGNAIKVTHSVNKGEYGGESIIIWDMKLEKLVSWYFTTAGFYTQANIKIDNNKIIFIEEVTGNQNGITEVKSTTQLLENGEKHTKAQYLQNGKWIDGHEIYYKEASEAKVIFK
tara:strand:+ start:53 stop:577 length:525 start_codon:yes stop_codon:yes gene_type:complete